MKRLGKLNLVLADADRDYVGSLSDYLVKHHAQSFDIHTFTCVESLKGFFSGGTIRVNIMVAGPGFIDAGIPEGSTDVKILLDDGKADACSGGLNAINRYQHVEKLITAVYGMYSDKGAADRFPPGRSGTLITAFISPAGGAGKSVISAGCSLLCARRGFKAFYLSLEDVSSSGLYFRGGSDQSFSNVIYYLKDKAGASGIKLAGARCADASSGVHFFLPPESPAEMSCLLPEDIKTLLDSFRLSGVYDAVFVDMPGGLDGRSIAVLNAADSIVCICGPDSASRFKSRFFQEELGRLEHRYVPGLAEKTFYVLNDSRGLGLDSAFTIAGRRPAVLIGECSVLKNTAAGELDLLDCGVDFTSSLSALLVKINSTWAVRTYGQSGGETLEA